MTALAQQIADVRAECSNYLTYLELRYDGPYPAEERAHLAWLEERLAWLIREQRVETDMMRLQREGG